MFTTAMLHVITEAGEGVLLLIDGLDDADFQRSRLTRQAVRDQLRLIAGTLCSLPDSTLAAMPELDGAGWRLVQQALAAPSPAGDDTAWFAARSLVPATLSWLRVYRLGQPGLFSGQAPR